jgi:hypothetical protein
MEKEVIRISRIFTKGYPGKLTREILMSAVDRRMSSLLRDIKKCYIPKHDLKYVNQEIIRRELKHIYTIRETVPHYITILAHHTGLALNVRYYCTVKINNNNTANPEPVIEAIGNPHDTLLANQIIQFFIPMFKGLFKNHEVTKSPEFKLLIHSLKLLRNETEKLALHDAQYEKVNHYILNNVKLRYTLKGGPHVKPNESFEGLHNALSPNKVYFYRKLIN